MKTVYQDENNVVLDENSAEKNPCINRESKSLELTIQLYSCHDINMKFLVVVTPPSIYQVASTSVGKCIKPPYSMFSRYNQVCYPICVKYHHNDPPLYISLGVWGYLICRTQNWNLGGWCSMDQWLLTYRAEKCQDKDQEPCYPLISKLHVTVAANDTVEFSGQIMDVTRTVWLVIRIQKVRSLYLNFKHWIYSVLLPVRFPPPSPMSVIMD